MDDVKEIKEEDLLVNFSKIDEKFENLSDKDKQFAYVQQGISTVQSINTVDTRIRALAKELCACIPDATVDVIKIISSRCDDLNPDELNDLSNGFIQQLLTVDGKTYQFVCPDSIKSKLPMDIKELDKLNFNRSMVMVFKTSSENIATWQTWKEKLQKALDEKVSDEVKAILASPDKMEAYTDEYYNYKANDPNVPEDSRKQFAEIIKWHNYAYTLEPIITSIKATIKKSGSAKSIMYGYRNNAPVTINDAAKVCKSKGFTFPPHILANSIETKLFGEKYEKYKYLLPYLVARHIKYLGNDMSNFEKIFITQLFTVMMYMVRMDEKNETCAKIKEKFEPGVKELLDVVISNI